MRGIDAVAQSIRLLMQGTMALKLFIAYMEKFIKRELPGLYGLCGRDQKRAFVVV